MMPYLKDLKNLKTLRRSQRASQERSGIVLFVVFVVVALAALAGYTFVVAVQGDSKAAQINADQLQAEHLSRSGEAFVMSWMSLPREERVALEEDLGNDIFAQQVLPPDQTGRNASTPIGSFYIVEPMSINELMAGNSNASSISVGSVRTRTAGGGSASSNDSKWRMGVVNESGKLHLHTLLTWDATWPGSGRQALLNLPGMTDEIADAILDWIDEDDEPREVGAEADEYAEQPRPYRPRNAIPDSLDELLLVRGVTPWLLYGEASPDSATTAIGTSVGAVNSNSSANSGPDNPFPNSQSESTGESTGGSGRGRGGSGSGSRNSTRPRTSSSGGSISANEVAKPWSHYLTVLSSERDESYSGARRIILNGDDLGKIEKEMKDLPREITKFILLYRQYGPYVNQPDEENLEVLFEDGNAKKGNEADKKKAKAKPPNNRNNRTRGNGGNRGNANDEEAEPEGDYVRIDDAELPKVLEAGAGIPRSPYQLLGAIVPLPAEESPDQKSRGNKRNRRGKPSSADKPGDANNESGGESEEEAPTPRFVRSPITMDTLSDTKVAAALDLLTIADARGGISGRLNLYEAPAVVIAGLPNLEPGQAERIIAARNTVKREDALESLAWLAKTDILSAKQFRELAPFFTVGGEVVTFDSIGSHGDRRLHHRSRVTVDASGRFVRRAGYRDQRRSGTANLFDDLPKATKPPTNRRSGSSRSKSR